MGETVEAGQLLIAGLYEQKVDPYSPPPENPYQILGAARGSVRALTYREFTVEVPQKETRFLPEGQRSTERSLVIFGLRIPLGFYASPKGEYRQWTDTAQWAPFGKALPLALESTTYEKSGSTGTAPCPEGRASRRERSGGRRIDLPFRKRHMCVEGSVPM